MSVISESTSQSRTKEASERKQSRNNMYILIGISIFAFVWLIPIIWTLSISFRPENSIISDLTRIVPIPFTLDNYDFIVNSSRIPKWFMNSLFVAIVRTILQLIVCSLAAYSFARIKFPGSKYIFFWLMYRKCENEQAEK